MSAKSFSEFVYNSVTISRLYSFFASWLRIRIRCHNTRKSEARKGDYLGTADVGGALGCLYFLARPMNVN